MQLGIRLHDTKKLPFEERIANVHELGFVCGHLAPGKVITEFPTTDEALTPGLAMYMKNVFAKNNVDIAVLGCYLNLANPNPEQLAKITHRYMAHIRFASWLGCGVVGTETGAPNETYTAVPECHGEEALQTFITNLRPVVKYAEEMGVVMAIEPVWKHIVYNPARARRVLDEINSPNLQIILDPVNLLDHCNYKDQVAIVDEAIDLLEQNKRKFGTDNLEIIKGLAPEALEGLPAPTHAFIGGSSGNLKEILEVLLEQNPRVRVVINAIALETVAEAMQCLKSMAFTDVDIAQVSVAKGKKLGSYEMMMGQNPVYIFSCTGGETA